MKEGINVKQTRLDAADKTNRIRTTNTAILHLGIDSYFIEESSKEIAEISRQNNKIRFIFIRPNLVGAIIQ